MTPEEYEKFIKRLRETAPTTINNTLPKPPQPVNREQYLRSIDKWNPPKPPQPRIPGREEYLKLLERGPTPVNSRVIDGRVSVPNREQFLRSIDKWNPPQSKNSGNSLIDSIRDRLRNAKDEAGKRAEAQIAAKAALEQMQAMSAPINDVKGQLGDIESQLNSIFSQPDIPGQWISPYSQGYLNDLGDRFQESGLSAQEQLAAAKAEIADNYASGTTQRNDELSAFNNELMSGLGNLGVPTENSAMLQRAATDADYLNQVTGQNQATDLSYNDKLGGLFAQMGDQLGAMSREGVLTPKQYVGPQSGISDGDRLKAGFLMDKYGDLQGSIPAPGQQIGDFLGLEDPESATDVTLLADEESEWLDPEFSMNLDSIEDPELRTFIQNTYDRAGNKIPEALQLLAETPEPITPLAEGPMPSIWDKGGLAKMLQHKMLQGLDAGRREQLGAQNELTRLAQEYFRSISPNYNPAIKSRTTADKSKTTL